MSPNRYKLNSFNAGFLWGDEHSRKSSLQVEETPLFATNYFLPNGRVYIPSSTPEKLQSHPISTWKRISEAPMSKDEDLDFIGECIVLGWRIADGVMSPPAWTQDLVGTLIYPGLHRVTWGHATKGGARVPSPDQMIRISAIAHIADQLLALNKNAITLWLPEADTPDVHDFPRLIEGDSISFVLDYQADGAIPLVLCGYTGGYIKRVRFLYNVDARNIVF